MRKAIIHIMPKKRLHGHLFKSELQYFQDMYQQDKIENIVFYKGDIISDDNSELSFQGLSLYNYSNKNDLEQQLTGLALTFDILHICTRSEVSIGLCNDLMSFIGKKVTDNPKIFRNKYLQREALQNYNKDLGIKFIQLDLDNLDYYEINQKVGTPFIIKPVNGLQSSGVVKIKKKKELEAYKNNIELIQTNCSNRGFESKIFIAEEYIAGDMYSIDYFVNEEQGIIMSKPVHVKIGTELGIDDFFNFARIVTEKVEKQIEKCDFEQFVEQTVKATGIRNNFIHHEFKITPTGKLKTIELNGRIGGYRLETMKLAYNIDLFRFILGDKQEDKKLKTNTISLSIYPTYTGKLISFNEKLFNKINLLSSVYKISKVEIKIGKRIGLTKDGFEKVAMIKMKNIDAQQLHKDLKFIEDNYSNLLDVQREGYMLIKKILKIFTFQLRSKKT